MARIARSEAPLYQTRDRPVFWTIALTSPDGSAIDLTGASASAALAWAGASRMLVVAIAPDASGILTVSGARALVAGLPTGRVNELTLTLTDTQGAMTDYVWPVIGETP